MYTNFLKGSEITYATIWNSGNNTHQICDRSNWTGIEKRDILSVSFKKLARIKIVGPKSRLKAKRANETPAKIRKSKSANYSSSSSQSNNAPFSIWIWTYRQIANRIRLTIGHTVRNWIAILAERRRLGKTLFDFLGFVFFLLLELWHYLFRFGSYSGYLWPRRGFRLIGARPIN